MQTDYSIIREDILSIFEDISKVVIFIQKQNYHQAMVFDLSVTDKLSNICEKILCNIDYFNAYDVIVTPEYLYEIVSEIMQVKESKDYVYLADIYELKFIPLLTNLQTRIVTDNNFPIKEVINKDNISITVEPTSCGAFTLNIKKGNERFYLNTNGNVFFEAITLANEWFSEDCFSYVIYGLGLGYHIKQLAQINDTIHIKVYESNADIIELAQTIGENSIFQSDRIEIIYDPSFRLLSKELSENKNIINGKELFYVDYPYIKMIDNDNIRILVEDYFCQVASTKNQLHMLNGNFAKNTESRFKEITEVKDEFKGKDLYIIAAGPSLDKNFRQLLNVDKEKSIIMATGTVYKKLIKEGIVPDYVIVIDAAKAIEKQVTDVENDKTKLLYMATAHYGAALKFKGEKYIIFQDEYKKSMNIASQHNYTLFATGGSVSTTALDIGIRFKCSRIIFLGLDLACTGERYHANEIDDGKADNVDMRIIKDINGKDVKTLRNLDMYRKWIERRIEADECKDIDIIDATEGGAKIKGMKICEASKIISG